MSKVTGVEINSKMFQNYIKALINKFFKILPMWEQCEGTADDSLITYMQSFQAELLGCKELVFEIKSDEAYLTLIAILQYLIDNPSLTVKTVRREVFKAISLCNKLISVYVTKV